ncbi:MAG TPA: glycosyltransferase family 2 protein, partial [Sphingomonas sp.]|nr:glycosyltransferase family 2 protein [Sphingomonas sp.]
MSDPSVHLYALVWNELPLLPFFLEHYRPFVDKFYLADDGSDDGSFEFLSRQPDVVIRKFNSGGDSFVERARRFYCEGWKESRNAADFVIVVNIDELVHHESPRAALSTARRDGITVIDTRGWEMVADEFPRQGPLAVTVPAGVHSVAMSKVAIFNPNAIQEINYGPGRHKALPTGHVVRPARPLFDLLHYKYLGADYLVDRYRQLGARMRPGDIEARHGVHYQKAEEDLRAEHARLRAAAGPVLPATMKSAGILTEPLRGVKVKR